MIKKRYILISIAGYVMWFIVHGLNEKIGTFIFILVTLYAYLSYKNDKKATDNKDIKITKVESFKSTDKNNLLDYYVAGSNYKYKEIHSLMNKEYKHYTNKDKFDGFTDKEISESNGLAYYEYPITVFYDVELIPEPNNPHDPNAIKVVVEDYHIGYIPSDSTSEVKKIMKQIKNIEVTIRKGRYKLSESFMEKPKLTKSDYSAGVKIYY